MPNLPSSRRQPECSLPRKRFTRTRLPSLGGEEICGANVCKKSLEGNEDEGLSCPAKFMRKGLVSITHAEGGLVSKHPVLLPVLGEHKPDPIVPYLLERFSPHPEKLTLTIEAEEQSRPGPPLPMLALDRNLETRREDEIFSLDMLATPTPGEGRAFEPILGIQSSAQELRTGPSSEDLCDT